MELINKILTLNIDEAEKQDLLKIAQNYEKKAGFFAGVFGLIVFAAIAVAGFWAAKFHQFSYSIKPMESSIVISEKTWWGLFEDDQEFVCSENKIVPK